MCNKAYLTAVAMVLAVAGMRMRKRRDKSHSRMPIPIALRQSSEVTVAENNVAIDKLAVADQKSRFLPTLSLSRSGG